MDAVAGIPRERLTEIARRWRTSSSGVAWILDPCTIPETPVSGEMLLLLRRKLFEHQKQTDHLLLVLSFLPGVDQADAENLSRAFHGLGPQSGKGPATGPVPPFDEADRQIREPGVGGDQ